MPENDYRVTQRFREFWTLVKSSAAKSPNTAMFFAAWLATLFIILLAKSSLPSVGIIHLLYVYFWFKLTIDLDRKFRPAVEFLIVVLFLFFWLENLLLQSVHAGIIIPGTISNFVQAILLAVLILLFSLILVQNSRTNFWFFAFAFLMTALLSTFIDRGGIFYSLAAQIILFIFLIRKTTWLELLTKSECWLYLVVLFLVFIAFGHIYPFGGYVEQAGLGAPALWVALPKTLYYGFKMYLLAVLVKIPVVLVYNFASLSRKLKFSSLFQSTFPQFIQLCVLMIIFFFFLAGWQAEKVRRTLVATIEAIAANPTSENAGLAKKKMPRSEKILRISGYQPVALSNRMPDQGVLALPRSDAMTNGDSARVDYFIFYESRGEDNQRSLNFVRLDSLSLQRISNGVSILAGSLLLAYPYQPPRWESYLYHVNFFKDEDKFWIFPFAVFPSRPEWQLAAPLTETSADPSGWTQMLDEKFLHRVQVNTGRVVAPMLDATMQRVGFFAFDISLIPQASFFSRALLSYIFFLVLVYAVVNAVVVGRMVKFGEEINQMIVQKFNQLKSGIREISSGNLDYKVKIEGRDEFVELGERFNTMGEKLKESIEEAREKERLEHELAIARQVQLELLPRTLPNIPGFEVAALLKTANEVGGDFYDLLPLDEQRYLFTIGDVSGKGTFAAFYMAQCLSLIRFASQFSHDPQEIVSRINKYFSDPLIDRQVFVTAVVGLLDLKNRQLQLVRAGHNPPILVPTSHAKEIVELKSDGLGIGLERNGGLFEKSLKPSFVKLQAGDLVVFYTDGFVEAAGERTTGANAGTEFYSEERLFSVLGKARGVSADDCIKMLSDDIEQFYAGRPLVDDYTLLVIRRAE
jgi:serine phosphatase RsbU (regulator of sigma subunit)